MNSSILKLCRLKAFSSFLCSASAIASASEEKMRWRWVSVCHLLLLLFNIARATEEETSTVAAVDSDPVAEGGAQNTSKPTNEIGCEVSNRLLFCKHSVTKNT